MRFPMINAKDFYVPAGRGTQVERALDKGCLAGAVRPYQAERHATRYFKVHAIEDNLPVEVLSNADRAQRGPVA